MSRPRNLLRCTLASCLAFALSVAVPSRAPHAAEPAPALVPGARVAIVGDSITEQRLYSRYVETWLLACSGVPDLSVFQFGWSGETASGFANRAENDLGVFRPTVVTLCYGMNDGGYQPWRDQIGTTYETNMRNVLQKLAALKVNSVVVGSPGAVDVHFFRPGQKLGDRPAHEAYNDTLAHLRDIDKKLAGELGLRFADVHGTMVDAMTKSQAVLGSGYDVCGKDGFHPGPNGQLAMAYAFLKGLGADGKIGEIAVDLAGGKATASDGHKVLASKGGTVELESTRWPFCFDGNETSSGGTRSIVPYLPFNQDLNRLVLKVSGLTAPKAKVKWGEATKEFSKEQLASGVNLAAEFAQTPFDAAFLKFTVAVAAKQTFETYMIKSVVTTFRSYPPELRADPELQAALKVVSGRFAARQAALDAEAKKLLVPVRHVVVVEPVE